MEGDRVNSNYTFPPGFRFHPSDEELIVNYLENKISSRPLPASIIAEIDLYKYNPWDLPKKALFGEDEWYFFSPRHRKYPNGARPNRAAASGYWKATGTDKPVLASCGSKRLGVKKALVFYSGRPPKGVKTDWIMNEYRLVDTTTKPSRAKGSMRLDDWVLCRVRHKGYSSKNACDNQENHSGQNLAADPSRGNSTCTNNQPDMITDYQYEDYRLLASILVGQPLLPTEAISSLSFEGNIGNSHAVYEDGFNFNKVNPQITVSSSCGYFDLLKGKSDDDNQNGNVISFHRKSNTDNTLQNFPSNVVVNNGGVNCYNQNQSQDAILNESQRDPIINFQELNELAFTGRFQQ